MWSLASQSIRSGLMIIGMTISSQNMTIYTLALSGMKLLLINIFNHFGTCCMLEKGEGLSREVNFKRVFVFFLFLLNGNDQIIASTQIFPFALF